MSFKNWLALISSFSPLGLVHGRYVMNQNGITWDQSCFGPKQQIITTAWEGALELADSAWTRFDTHTRPVVERGPLDSVAQQHINQNDPAYVQMFANDWSTEGVAKIRSVLSNLVQRVNSPPGENGRPDWDSSWLTIRCPQLGEHDCQESDNAITFNERKSGQWEGSSMDFCPEFFENDRFSDLKAASKRPFPEVHQIDDHHVQVQSLFMDPDYTGSDATAVLHEMTHLWWIGPTNVDPVQNTGRVEEYGYLACADLTWNDGCVMFDNPDVVWNADHYAWYAEYGYWAERGFDSWPEQDKPVKLDVHPE